MSLCELHGGELTGRNYHRSGGFSNSLSKTNKQSGINLFQWFLTIFKDVFLPAGYPNTVSSDYLSYQIWDTIQAFASSITNALAFSAILEGMGVGDEKASVLSATFVWLVKDGVGMLGRILFAWYHGTGLDSNLKMWRFYADILNDLAISIDLIAPFFRNFLLPITCLSNLCRSIVGVAGGSTRAALTQHQAVAQNMGDVSAKDGSQETLVNLLALIVNLYLLHAIKGDRKLVWTLYFLLTSLHLYANYRAIRSLQLRTWNWNRFVLICEDYFRWNRISSIESINQREPLLYEVRQSIQCRVGISITADQAESIDVNRLPYDRFAISFDRKSRTFQVILADQCEDQHLIRCYFLLQHLIYHNDYEEYFLDRSKVVWIDIHRLQQDINRKYDEFLMKAKYVGWETQQAKFLTSSYRYMCKNS